MLLSELKQVQKRTKHLDRKALYPNELGTGADAEVYQHPKKSNTVVKFAFVRNPKHDGFVDYVKMIEQHKDNIFFPRIYTAKLYDHSNPKYEDEDYNLVVTMEKLIPLNHPKVAHMRDELLKSIGISEKDLADMRDLFGTREADSHETLRLKAKFSSPRWRRRLMAVSTNDEFKRALQLLEPLMSKYATDLHLNNFMVRLTGTGPQLVITDPFYTENPAEHRKGLNNRIRFMQNQKGIR